MKRLKAMSNREWVQRHKSDFKWVQKHYPDFINEKYSGGVAGCPYYHYGLDDNCLQFGCCADCWDSTAKRNGKYIMKAVKE